MRREVGTHKGETITTRCKWQATSRREWCFSTDSCDMMMTACAMFLSETHVHADVDMAHPIKRYPTR